MQKPSVWIAQFEKEKFPKVEGNSRNYREDFKVLYPITLSARRMACLGEFVGEVPNISEEIFNRLRNHDPFQSDKKIWETFQLIVQPLYIKRKFNKELLKDLLECGDYSPETTPTKEQDLLIPCSPRNIFVLSIHPLVDNEMPVFDSFTQNIYEQCNYVATKVIITLMRKEVPKKTRALDDVEQEKLMNAHGFEMPSFQTRVLANTVEILNTGTCPDTHMPHMTYVRTSNWIKINQKNCRIGIGGFVLARGMDVIQDDCSSGPFTGTVPCLNLSS